MASLAFPHDRSQRLCNLALTAVFIALLTNQGIRGDLLEKNVKHPLLPALTKLGEKQDNNASHEVTPPLQPQNQTKPEAVPLYLADEDGEDRATLPASGFMVRLFLQKYPGKKQRQQPKIVSKRQIKPPKITQRWYTELKEKNATTFKPDGSKIQVFRGLLIPILETNTTTEAPRLPQGATHPQSLHIAVSRFAQETGEYIDKYCSIENYRGAPVAEPPPDLTVPFNKLSEHNLSAVRLIKHARRILCGEGPCKCY